MNNKLNFQFCICLISVFFIFLSCGNNDDENPQEKSIVGTWTYSSSDYDATINGQSYLSFLMENFDISEWEAQALADVFFLQETENFVGTTLTFHADGTYVLRDKTSEEETGTYSLQNNETQLTLNPDEGDSLVLNVTEFTTSTLTLAFSVEEMEDINEDGDEETLEISLEMSFMK